MKQRSPQKRHSFRKPVTTIADNNKIEIEPRMDPVPELNLTATEQEQDVDFHPEASERELAKQNNPIGMSMGLYDQDSLKKWKR